MLVLDWYGNIYDVNTKLMVTMVTMVTMITMVTMVTMVTMITMVTMVTMVTMTHDTLVSMTAQDSLGALASTKVAVELDSVTLRSV